MKKDLKIMFTVLFVMVATAFVVVVVGVAVVSSWSHTYKGVDKIPEHHVLYADLLEQAGNYSDAQYQLYYKNMAVFSSKASVLVLTYSDLNYKAEVEKIEEQYIFLKKPAVDSFGEVAFSDYEFDIGKWHFRACDSDGKTVFYYPKQFRIVGFNDEERSIAYLDFCDEDLDTVSESPKEFIEDYFNYSFDN